MLLMVFAAPVGGSSCSLTNRAHSPSPPLYREWVLEICKWAPYGLHYFSATVIRSLPRLSISNTHTGYQFVSTTLPIKKKNKAPTVMVDALRNRGRPEGRPLTDRANNYIPHWLNSFLYPPMPALRRARTSSGCFTPGTVSLVYSLAGIFY